MTILVINLLFTGEKAIMVTSLTSSEVTLSSNKKVRFRSRVAYDGTNFLGFQVQGEESVGQRSVQGALEDAFSQHFKRPVRVVGAGRTDAGVHSRGQAIHFDLYENETSSEVVNSLCSNCTERCENYSSDHIRTPCLQSIINQMLPSDVRVWNLQKAPSRQEELVNRQKSVVEWNAMMKCTSKLYSYRLCIGSFMDPIDRHGRWQLDWGHEVNPSDLRKALKLCEGTHDFRCFAGALEQNERKSGKRMGTVRTIHSVELIEERQPDLYRIDLYLDGALYKMVRNIVGTSLDVCRGKLSEQDFEELLNPSDDFSRRDNPCKPAPPQGLCLEHVFYPDDNF